MDGTIYKRSNGTWAYSIYVGKDENGKQKRVFKSGFATKREADAAKNERLRELKRGPARAPHTLADVVEEWFRQHVDRRLSPKTAERYRELWAYVHPDVKSATLSDASALVLEREYNRLLDAGGHDRKTKQARPLSTKTVREIASIIHAALGKAVKWKLLPTNPADDCELPKQERKEAVALDCTMTDWFLGAAEGHWIYPILLVAVSTGCRRGELLALQWRDLNLESTPSKMVISKSLEQTKAGLRIKGTKSGKPRDFPLPAIAVDQLRKHRIEQEINRVQFATDYRADLDLVFCTPNGDYLKPDSVTATACLIAKKAGLKGVGLHSLRHSHGSQLLAIGTPLATVSKRLGHASTYVTSKVYAHSFTRDEIAAAENWDNAMRAVVTAEKQKARQ